jgi:hypothetical protein
MVTVTQFIPHVTNASVGNVTIVDDNNIIGDAQTIFENEFIGYLYENNEFDNAMNDENTMIDLRRTFSEYYINLHGYNNNIQYELDLDDEEDNLVNTVPEDSWDAAVAAADAWGGQDDEEDTVPEDPLDLIWAAAPHFVPQALPLHHNQGADDEEDTVPEDSWAAAFHQDDDEDEEIPTCYGCGDEDDHLWKDPGNGESYCESCWHNHLSQTIMPQTWTEIVLDFHADVKSNPPGFDINHGHYVQVQSVWDNYLENKWNPLFRCWLNELGEAKNWEGIYSEAALRERNRDMAEVE